MNDEEMKAVSDARGYLQAEMILGGQEILDDGVMEGTVDDAVDETEDEHVGEGERGGAAGDRETGEHARDVAPDSPQPACDEAEKKAKKESKEEREDGYRTGGYGTAPVVDETELMDDLADRALDNAEVAASKDARVSRFEAATEKIRAEAEHVFDHRKDDDDGRVAGKDD